MSIRCSFLGCEATIGNLPPDDPEPPKQSPSSFEAARRIGYEVAREFTATIIETLPSASGWRHVATPNGIAWFCPEHAKEGLQRSTN